MSAVVETGSQGSVETRNDVISQNNDFINDGKRTSSNEFSVSGKCIVYSRQVQGFSE